MMRHACAAVFAACLSVLAAPPLAAQHFSWENYCTVGEGPLCLSLELDLTPDGNGTSVGIRMRNLQGTLGTTPWGLYGIGFLLEMTNQGFSAADLYPRATMSGTAQQIVTADPATCAMFLLGCSGPLWGIMPWEWRDVGPGIGVFRSTIANTGATPIGIVGCDAPAQPGGGPPNITDSHWALGYFQTCGDGWVNVNFRIAETLTFTEQSRVFVMGYDGATFQPCEFDVTCVPVTATPEPGTLVLLGSGLAGVLGWRRRRQMRAA